MSIIAVATIDGKAYYNLVSELKRKKIKFIVKKPSERIPLNVKAVITTKEEAKLISHKNIIIYDSKGGEAAVEKAAKILSGIESYNTLTIGIDPGKKIGLAIVGDGVVIKANTYDNLKDILRAIKREAQKGRQNEVVIKIGKSGSIKTPNSKKEEQIENAHKIMEAISREIGGTVKLYFVDEKDTTKIAKKLWIKRKEKDESSAIEIALKEVKNNWNKSLSQIKHW
jgi:serine/threonine protein phosphatase PrpC